MRWLIKELILLYQKLPLHTHTHCRFYPTCSNYMLESIDEYGLVKGLFIGIKRILRCHPFGKSGYDPVPKKENKMKKIIGLFGIIMGLMLLSGCVLEKPSNKIYTTSYPITFITTYLYQSDDNIESIYPNETNINDYVMTKKMIKEYSNGNIFIYNGLSNEKDYAKKMINNNHRLNIVDAAENLRYTYDIKETWLSPDNFLMLAKNIKNRLVEISTSQDEIKMINDNFKTLEQEISSMDAYLRNIATEATKDDKKPVLVVATSDFKYLEDYGFEIITLDATLSDNSVTTIKANFKNKKYTTILAFDGYENSDLVNELINDYEAKLKNINPIYTLSNDDITKNETYTSLMNNYIDTIRSTVVK